MNALDSPGSKEELACLGRKAKAHSFGSDRRHAGGTGEGGAGTAYARALGQDGPSAARGQRAKVKVTEVRSQGNEHCVDQLENSHLPKGHESGDRTCTGNEYLVARWHSFSVEMDKEASIRRRRKYLRLEGAQ